MTEDELILTHLLNCSRSELYLKSKTLNSQQQKQFEDFKARRLAGEPLQYILGVWDFMGLELSVNSSVLVPRPETEQLVEQAIKIQGELQKVNILDLGTGSGNIAIALAKFVPAAHVISIDISSQALDVAKCNAKKHGVDDRIKFIKADILKEDLAKILGPVSFDLIISNPPYIPSGQMSSLPQDVQKEPGLALDGGEDGLDFYRAIIKWTPYLLRKGGCLMMEFGDGQSEALKKIVCRDARNGVPSIEIIKDLAGRERVIFCRWSKPSFHLT
ncbi:MAG: peptide chain release factor N(5)-glutamine methyltransferase [Candidatus Omnitrophica bacterium]|nr:peptide chain release factor N(5)-glutamine methyltransferase [Candidatus Omnitrophota bacterium]